MTFAINTINASSSTLTMSSREIAELTGKRHDNVMADIREMLETLEEGLLKFQDTYVHPQNGQSYKCFNLPKDLTITLISGYNVKMRHAITKRWMELEAAAKPALALPTSFHEALLLAAKLEGERVALALENSKQAEVIAEQGEVIAIAAPKAEFYDAVMDTSKVYTPTEVANILGLDLYRSGKKVNELLVEMGWQYKRGTHWYASSLATSKGYLQSKVFVNEDTGFSGTKIHVTVNGLSAIRKRFSL